MTNLNTLLRRVADLEEEVNDLKAEGGTTRRLLESDHQAVMDEFGSVRSRLEDISGTVDDLREAVTDIKAVQAEHTNLLREILLRLPAK